MAYTPSNGTLSNKPYSLTTASPTDGRSYYYDTTNFLWRAYQSKAEVLAYLDTNIKRSGHFSVFVNTGTLNSNGTFTSGVVTEYWFKDGIADIHLVEKLPVATTTTSGTVTIGPNLNVTNGVLDFPGLSNGAFTQVGKNPNGGPYYINSTVPYIGGYQWGLAGRYVLATILNNAGAIVTDLAHTHDTVHIIAGVFNPARLGTGTANNTTILYGDGVWRAAPSGTGGEAANVIAYTTSIPFNHRYTRIADHTLTADTVITPLTSGATADSFAVQNIILNGHTIQFSGMHRQGTPDDLTGVEYNITYWYDGTRYFYETKPIDASGGSNITPAAPNIVANDSADTLVFSHTLGNSEIMVSENDGEFTQYTGTISVGDVARPLGYWKAKIKSASGRNESPVASSPAFTVAGGVSYDTNSIAFFTAQGITDTPTKNKLDNLMVGLNAEPTLKSKIVQMLVNVKGSVTNKIFNFINPVDTDGAFRAIPGAGIVWDNSGLSGNGGSTGFVNTKVTQKPNLLDNGFPNAGWTWGAYVINGQGTIMGVHDFSGQAQTMAVSGTSATINFGQNISTLTATLPSAKGVVVMDTPGALENSNVHRLRFNGTTVATSSPGTQIDGSNRLPTYLLATDYIGGHDSDTPPITGDVLSASTSKIGITFFAQELTNTEHDTIATLINEFETAYGR